MTERDARGGCAETALTFDCDGQTLVGVVAAPRVATAAAVGVVIVVGGPQYRAGSHRHFTRLARDLAAAGWPTLRFDLRGMGDSSGELRQFDDASADIGAAIDALQRAQPGVRQVVLWGLCDGASAALLYLDERADQRVRGLCLANPWVRSVHSVASMQVKHYYTQRLLEPGFWLKLARGGVGLGALRGFGRALRAMLGGASAGAGGNPAATAAGRAADFRTRMARALVAFDAPVLLSLSGDDYIAKEFLLHIAADRQWQQALASRSVQRLDLPGADHTFSDRQTQQVLLAHTLGWLAACNAGGQAVAPVTLAAENAAP